MYNQRNDHKFIKFSLTLQKKEVVGHESLKAPSLPPGKRYTLRVSATPQELVRVTAVKVLATQEGSIIYPEVANQFKQTNFIIF